MILKYYGNDDRKKKTVHYHHFAICSKLLDVMDGFTTVSLPPNPIPGQVNR